MAIDLLDALSGDGIATLVVRAPAGTIAATGSVEEDGRNEPDRAVRSYLRVIRRLPDAASEALEGRSA